MKVLVIIAASCLVLLLAGRFTLKGDKDTVSGNTGLSTYTVKRGDLVISVTESGGIAPINSNEIRSKVEGRTTIISIVDEGYVITPEDVNNEKILVQLDSSEIEKRLNQQELSYSSSNASLTEARESLQIQIKLNESNIRDGEMKVRFALIDLRKYLGRQIADKLVEDASNSESLAKLDIRVLLNDGKLGGEALQEISQLTSDIELANSKYERAKDRLEGTKELFKEKYVAETELKADEFDEQSSKAQVERSEIALELFKLYEFPKKTEELLSGYLEALNELDRIKANARSELAQKRARLKNREKTFKIEEQQLEKMNKQLDACTIKAPSPGQVVYARSRRGGWGGGRIIEEGAEIRERQSIISIPDTSQMKVVIKVHETWIGKIEAGQKANITVSAFTDKSFQGEVIKKAPMADPENWFNPDLKVYSTDVSIEGKHDYLKTGMTAKVEVIIKNLKDVLTVPIQSVITVEGQKYCFVLNNSGKGEKREIQIGVFNTDFIEVKSGLAEGEKVLLNPPRFEDTGSDKAESKKNASK